MKERFEWIHSWCEETTNEDVPRVLLVGDSITRASYEFAQKALAGVCYVDYVATSYAVDTEIYQSLIRSFIADSKYALVHYNHGLHGFHMTKQTYKTGVEKILKVVPVATKIVLATTTVTYKEYNEEIDEAWQSKIEERNAAVNELAKEHACIVHDLYEFSLAIPKEMRFPDGVHYEESGRKKIGEKIAAVIKENVK